MMTNIFLSLLILASPRSLDLKQIHSSTQEIDCQGLRDEIETRSQLCQNWGQQEDCDACESKVQEHGKNCDPSSYQGWSPTTIHTFCYGVQPKADESRVGD